MAFDPHRALDQIDWAILDVLQVEGRIPFSELARRVSLSAPAVTERVRRLEEAGVIRGYRAEVDLKALGVGIEAIVRVRDAHNDAPRIRAAISDRPEVLDCSHITGEDCWIVRVAVPSMERLEEVVGFLAGFGPPTTSLVFSSPVRNRAATRELLDTVPAAPVIWPGRSRTA